MMMDDARCESASGEPWLRAEYLLCAAFLDFCYAMYTIRMLGL
jgi:hypothetical protein